MQSGKRSDLCSSWIWAEHAHVSTGMWVSSLPLKCSSGGQRVGFKCLLPSLCTACPLIQGLSWKLKVAILVILGSQWAMEIWPSLPYLRHQGKRCTLHTQLLPGCKLELRSSWVCNRHYSWDQSLFPHTEKWKMSSNISWHFLYFSPLQNEYSWWFSFTDTYPENTMWKNAFIEVSVLKTMESPELQTQDYSRYKKKSLVIVRAKDLKYFLLLWYNEICWYGMHCAASYGMEWYNIGWIDVIYELQYLRSFLSDT